MDTQWLVPRVVDGILHVSSKPQNACLVRDPDSLAWAKELSQLHARYECDVVVVDLSGVDFISYVALEALDVLAAKLTKRSGRLFIGGVRSHVLAIFLALAPHLEATNDPVAKVTLPHALTA